MLLTVFLVVRNQLLDLLLLEYPPLQLVVEAPLMLPFQLLKYLVTVTLIKEHLLRLLQDNLDLDPLVHLLLQLHLLQVVEAHILTLLLVLDQYQVM